MSFAIFRRHNIFRMMRANKTVWTFQITKIHWAPLTPNVVREFMTIGLFIFVSIRIRGLNTKVCAQQRRLSLTGRKPRISPEHQNYSTYSKYKSSMVPHPSASSKAICFPIPTYEHVITTSQYQWVTIWVP